jgi:hypothetical protein
VLKNSKIFIASFSTVIDFCRPSEVFMMRKLTGVISRRNRRHTTVREDDSLTELIFSGLNQKGSFSTE